MGGNLAHLFTSVTSFVQQCASILRLKEFDTATPQGRSRERYRRVALTAFSQTWAKAITFASILIAYPLTLHYLGSERFGLWMTISSIVIMMRFADFGLGTGLMNAVAEAHGREDRQAVESYAASGFFMLCAIACVITAGFFLAYPFISWQRVFNLKSQLAIQEAGPAMIVFIACFAVNLPLGVVQRVQLGYQEGYLKNVWEIIGKVLGLVGLLLVIYFTAGLFWLVLALIGAPVLGWLLNSVIYTLRRPWLRPRLQVYNSIYAKKILHAGLLFFALNTTITLIYASDNLIITQFLGPEAVTQYAIPYRMFSIIFVFYNVVITPLWPAYGEAIARHDIAWVKKTLSRSLKLILVSAGSISVLLVIFGNNLLHLWVGPQISQPLQLSTGLGLWMILFTSGNTLLILLNAANILRFQIIFASLTLVFSILFKCIFVYYFNLPGIIWGTILAYIIFFVIPYVIFIHKYLYSNIIPQSNISLKAFG